MKRLILCLVLVFGLAQFSYLIAQEEQVEQFHLGSIQPGQFFLELIQPGQFNLDSITDIPAIVASTTKGGVVALWALISDSNYLYYAICYNPGQIWYMYIYVVNTSSETQSFKLEFDLRYGNGLGYKVYRSSQVIAGLGFDKFRINVTSYVAKLGVLTLTGRVYGEGMGNDNKVTSQVFVY
jgi:hypothetical protein